MSDAPIPEQQAALFVEGEDDELDEDQLRTARNRSTDRSRSSEHHWNPLAWGTPSEQADKLIAAEEWTEPPYARRN